MGATGHEDLPRFMELAPLVGSALLAVPVAAQRGWEPAAVGLVVVVAVVAVIDHLGRVPKSACTVAVLVSILLLLRTSEESDVAPFYLVALIAASAASDSTRRSVAVTVASLAVLVAAWVPYDDGRSGLAVWTFGMLLAYLGGAGVRAQTRLAAELKAAHEDLASRAAADERQRIAREVHDVIAHSLTVTMLHLTGARLSLESGDAPEAADALREAERLGLQSLGDIRRVVGVLGSPDATAAPQPSAVNIPGLVDDYASAGLDVSLAIDGELDALSPATGLGLYRIVQEALANVGRHAPGARASVAIRVGPADVDVVVANTVAVHAGTAPTSAAPDLDGGLGVEGMRARASALGGTCTAGPTDDGGWHVRVVVPRAAP